MTDEIDPDGVYYKIFLSRDDLVTICCMQWFDEYDYDQNRFFKDENGDQYRFHKEQEAIDFVNEKFKKECIDPEYAISQENLFGDKLK